MGMNWSGQLCLGVDLGYEDWQEKYPLLYEDGLDDMLAAAEGIVSPWDRIPEIANATGPGADGALQEYKQKNPDFEAELDYYYTKKRELEKEAPVEVVYYGSYEYSGIILAAKGLSYSNYQGEPIEIPPKIFREHLPYGIQEFCSKYFDIDFLGEAKWLLSSFYG